MAMATARSVLRTALRRTPRAPASKRNFSSSANHDDACFVLVYGELYVIYMQALWLYLVIELFAFGLEKLETDFTDETAKWEKITYVGIVACTTLAFYNLSKGHPHYDEPPAYPYLHVRNKEFPWGPDGLFETKHEAEHH